MKKIWQIIKNILLWAIGIFGLIYAVAVFLESSQFVTKIFTIILFLVSVYILPAIYKMLNFNARPLITVAIFLVGFIGSIATVYINTEVEKTETVETEKTILYSTTNNLNVRKNGSINDKVLFQINKGDELILLKEGDEWSEIECEKGRGFVANEFITEEIPSEADFDWIAYVIVGIIVLVSLSTKGGKKAFKELATNISSTSPTMVTKSKDSFHLIIDNGKVFLRKENSTMKKPVFSYFDNAIDCDLEDSFSEKSRFLVVTTKGEVLLCQLNNTGKKKVFYSMSIYGNAYKAKFASSETFIFNTDKGNYKGYFNSTRKDTL